MFRTWLYAFGLVELSLKDGNVDSFRLTDAGLTVLRGESTEAQTQPTAEQAPAWVVQPNFDVVVYLADASTEQVAFLEQHAERVKVSQHTAHYHLTRDSIYEGLQRGTDAEHLIATLAAGSRVELPASIAFEIRSWTALRERIVLRQRSELIEFPDAAARESAVKRGLAGLLVADRFLLLPGNHENAQTAKTAPEIFDYAAKPVPKCLSVSEDGILKFTTERRDLLTLGYLNLWAEPEGNSAWRLTRERVAETIKAGRTLAELLTFLQDRLTHPLPGLLAVALRVWAGEPTAAGMASVVILQCSASPLLDALLASKTLKPHLLGRIGPDAILVRSAGVKQVKATLQWAGVHLSETVTGHK